MPDAYDIHEARFVQYRANISAANATLISVGAVPAGKVWTILSALAYCSVAETQAYWFSVFGTDLNYYPITAPESATITPTVLRWYPMVREGMEFKLYPGEQLVAHRAAATAGSTMGIYARLIESDLPYYHYDEPQRKIVERMIGHRAAGAAATVRGSTTEVESGRGGRGGPERK